MSEHVSTSTMENWTPKTWRNALSRCSSAAVVSTSVDVALVRKNDWSIGTLSTLRPRPDKQERNGSLKPYCTNVGPAKEKGCRPGRHRRTATNKAHDDDYAA